MRFQESINLLPPKTARQLREYRARGSYYVFHIHTTRARMTVELSLLSLPPDVIASSQTLDQNIHILRSAMLEQLFSPPSAEDEATTVRGDRIHNPLIHGHLTMNDFDELFASFHLAVVHAAELWFNPSRIPPESNTRLGLLEGSGVTDADSSQAYVNGRLVQCRWRYTRHVMEDLYSPTHRNFGRDFLVRARRQNLHDFRRAQR